MTIDRKPTSPATSALATKRPGLTTKSASTPAELPADVKQTQVTAKTTSAVATTAVNKVAKDGVDVAGFSAVAKTLDSLWAATDYEKILSVIAEEVAPLERTDFSGLTGSALVGAAETLYVYEERVKATLNKMSSTDQGPLKLDGLKLMQRIAGASTKVFRAAVVLQDAADSHPVSAWLVAKDTHKTADKWDHNEHRGYVAQKTVEFYLKGGKEGQIGTVDAAFLKRLDSGALCEYVVDAYDNARASVVIDGRPSPGHTVLADGNDALTAGTFEVQKNQQGEITQVLIGTFSGHFRTGLDVQEHLVRHVLTALESLYPNKSHDERLAMIVRREGQATNPRTIEVIGRGIGLEGAEAQRLETALKAEAMRWHPLEQTGGMLDKGAGMSPLGKELKDSKDWVVGAIKHGLFLASSAQVGLAAKPNAARSAMELLAKLDDFAGRAQKEGEAVVVGQLVGILNGLHHYVGSLTAEGANPAVATELDRLAARWNVGVAGTTGTDLGLIFSPKPAGRETRIVATVDPKATDAQLKDLVQAGADVARFNTAHGSVDDKIVVMKKLRRFAAEMGKEITIQVDLEGPKLRLRSFENPKGLEHNDVFLKVGETATLTTRDVEGSQAKMLFPVDYPKMCDDVQVGHKVSMNDGIVQLVVKSIDKAKGTVTCEVTAAGKVWDNKGVAFPQTKMSGSAVTDEDLQNLTALIDHVDIFAQSFVQSAADVLFLRDRMADLGVVKPIIAKIERGDLSRDVDALTSIALASDGLMVARGDLGTELGEAEVHEAERTIREVGERTGRPVMLATEVMLSILKESRGSRGDVDALVGAVSEQRFQAIMLGKETSAHKSPGDVVRTVSQYIRTAEEARSKQKPKRLEKINSTTAASLLMRRPLTTSNDPALNVRTPTQSTEKP